MGQHLHLYASKTLTVEQVGKWCHARAMELSEVPPPADVNDVRAVEAEMAKREHHLEHWSNWAGPMIWDFMVCDAFLCDEQLVQQAVASARARMIDHPYLAERYPGRDFTTDTPVEFLRNHIGYVVWGDSDGI